MAALAAAGGYGIGAGIAALTGSGGTAAATSGSGGLTGAVDDVASAVADDAASVADDVANAAGSGGNSASGLGDLTNAEVQQIQNVVDQAGRPLEVVGSAARGARQAGSDIDYLVPNSSRNYFQGLDEVLPSVDPSHGIVPGTHNPFLGPAIRFEPGASPFFIPGKL